jgi:hypothetical protein
MDERFGPGVTVRVFIISGLLLMTFGTLPLQAQQWEDRYSIPTKARYQPSQIDGKRPLTRAERTGFTETSLYADVVLFIDSLKVLGADIETGFMGRTTEGRDLPYVIASRPLITTPEEAWRQGRPVAYIQANIHAGEVEGKEAMLAMLRDLAFDPEPNVLDSIVLIVQPIYNADGNERLGENNRRSQNGPALAGTRRTAADINLNRDYVGADAPETRASLAMLNRWDPNLFMDLHTTDGSMHGYALTYAPPLMPTAVTAAPYMFDTMLPEIRERVLDRQGFHMHDYGNFSRPRPANPEPGAERGYGRGGASLETMIADSVPSGWTFRTYDHLPCYGTNYYGLRGRLSILSEAFSHDPFPRRVASTYALVNEALSYIAENRVEVLALAQRADSSVAAWADDPGTSPPLALGARMDTTRVEEIRVEEIVPLTDSARAEPGMGNRQRTGIIHLVSMPVMASFAPTLTRTLPFAYAFDAAAADSLRPILATHGLQMEELTAPATVMAQAFVIDSIIDGGRRETPRNLKSLTGGWTEPASRTLPMGTFVVRAGQPLGLLAFYLLEAESDDGLMSYLDGVMSAGREYPILRITARETLTTRAVR